MSESAFQQTSLLGPDRQDSPSPPAAVATGTLIPGAMERAQQREFAWLKKATHWGEVIRYPDDRLGPPERMWMMLGANGNVRFYAVGQGQQGVEHQSVVAATYWYMANGWLNADAEFDMDAMNLALAGRAWVLAGGAKAEQENSPVEVRRG